MLNQVVLVGRLTDDPDMVTKENGKKVSAVTLAVQRSFKNSDGLYECDFIRCVLWNAIASRTCEFCHKGDVVGIKGRIQSREYTNSEDEKKHIVEVVAEKVTFLSSKPKEADK